MVLSFCFPLTNEKAVDLRLARLAFAGPGEVLNQILARQNVQAFRSTMISYAVLLLIGFFVGKGISAIFKRSRARLIYYLLFGSLGLMIEWFLLGNAPVLEPLQVITQPGMFTYWGTMLLAPWLMMEPDLSVLKWTFAGYFVLFSIFYLLVALVRAQGQRRYLFRLRLLCDWNHGPELLLREVLQDAGGEVVGGVNMLALADVVGRELQQDSGFLPVVLGNGAGKRVDLGANGIRAGAGCGRADILGVRCGSTCPPSFFPGIGHRVAALPQYGSLSLGPPTVLILSALRFPRWDVPWRPASRPVSPSPTKRRPE